MPDPDTIDAPLQADATTAIVGYRLRRAQLAVFQRFIAAFAALDLRPAEYSVLALIAANPGRKQSEIAGLLGIKRANFVTLINGLEARGLTERRAAPGDRRANALHLTAAGTRFTATAQAIQNDFELATIRRLGGVAEKQRLLDLLDRLMA